MLRSRIDRVVPALMSARLMFLLAAVPLAAALYATPEWQAWFGIPTPDQSLIPNVDRRGGVRNRVLARLDCAATAQPARSLAARLGVCTWRWRLA